MNVQPYLSFEGRAQEAIDFYKSALGAKVDVIMHFKDAPPEVQSQMSPQSRDKIMHAAFKIGDTQVMASDGQCSGKSSFSGIALTLNAASNAEAEKLFNALAQGARELRHMRSEMRCAVFREHHLFQRARAGVGLERQHA